MNVQMIRENNIDLHSMYAMCSCVDEDVIDHDARTRSLSDNTHVNACAYFTHARTHTQSHLHACVNIYERSLYD